MVKMARGVMSLKKDPAFKALQEHYETIGSKIHMRKLFDEDPKRFDKFRYVVRPVVSIIHRFIFLHNGTNAVLHLNHANASNVSKLYIIRQLISTIHGKHNAL